MKSAGSEPWCRLLLSGLVLEETGQPILRGPRKDPTVSPARASWADGLFAPSWPAWGLIGSLTKHVPKEPSQELCRNYGSRSRGVWVLLQMRWQWFGIMFVAALT